MVVIDRKEFIVILLADLVSDDLPVDDGRHLVLALYGGWMYGYFADLDLPAARIPGTARRPYRSAAPS